MAYREELRASPPRWVKITMMKPVMAKVARPLFQVTEISSMEKSTFINQMKGGTSNEDGNRVQAEGDRGVVDSQNGTSEQFANIVKELHVACYSVEASWAAQGSGGKERVPFRTNMSTEDESSDGSSVEQQFAAPLIAFERFHARKFKGRGEAGVGKWVVLTVTRAGSTKKQKTLAKECMKGALKDLVEREEPDVMLRTTGDVPLDLHEMDVAMDAKPSTVGLTHMTGIYDESHQKQWVS
jgi:hypothetical protein